LGRATAAGMAGALTWSFFIEPVIQILSPFGGAIPGPIGDFFRSLPNYLIGPNISTLLDNQYQFLAFGLQSTTLTPPVTVDFQALAVLAVYLVLFIGVAWWVSLRRDITN
jgi:ABC-type transport system involved in multi-copper enzyme maturation permease subunit